MNHIGVVGCGLMGSGIAQVCVQSGRRVSVVEIDEAVRTRGMKRIHTLLEKSRRRGVLTDEQCAAANDNISASNRLETLESCDLIIEAVTERPDIKKSIFEKLDGIAPPKCIFASNTSSISITELASVTRRAERFVGMHFFNPVPVMKLVEIVRGVNTNDATMDACTDFARSIGKEPVVCRDTPAFIVNKLLVPYLLDAIRMLESGVATAEDIDAAMVHGTGYPMGPIRLIDYVGLDTACHVADVMYNELGETRFKAPVLLRRLVEAGHYGRKTGRGFYDYESKE